MPAHTTVAREVLRLGAHNGAHRVALRAGISVLVPLMILWSVDQVPWSIYAAFGAMTSLYGRSIVGLERVRMQGTLAVLLTWAVGLGALVSISEHRGWLAVPVAALVAGVGSWISDVESWHPPGPLFLIFAFAAVASIPGEAADLPIAVGVAGSAALFSLLVGSAGAVWRRLRTGAPLSSPTRLRPPPRRVARRHVARGVTSVVIAGSLATAIGIGHPYWAMVSAVVPLVAKDLLPQAVRGIQRIIGTALGLVSAALLLELDLPVLALILVVVVMQVAAELLVGRNYAIALVAITPLALLMVHLAAPTPTRTLIIDRGVETLIGVAIGILIGYVTRDRKEA